MTIFTDTPVRQSSLDEFQAPLGDVLAARAGEAFDQGLSYIVRSGELVKAQEGNPRGFLGVGGRYEPETSLLRPEEARQRVNDAGVDLTIPEEGIRGGALDILIETKREEKRRQDIISRGPSGVVAGALGLGASFVGAAADPLNIAAAFVPVVSQARYARMLGAAGSAIGRAGVRAGVGAVEGAVGTAILEPFVYKAAKSLQVDYDISDSLLNIGVGTVFGGGLHVGTGIVADALAKGGTWRTAKATDPLPRLLESVDFKDREAMLRTSVAQALTGREIDVEAMLPRRLADEYGAAQERGDVAKAGDPSPSAMEGLATVADIGLTFRTAKGSAYEVHPDGTTTRNKAARTDPGHEGDSGPKPRTERTVYVDTNASELSAAGLSGLGEKGARVALKDGKAALLTWNKARGQWGTIAKNIPVHNEPAVGRYPLELWKSASDVPGYEAYSKMHAGNAITELQRSAAPATRPRGAKAKPDRQALQAAAQANAKTVRMADPEAVRRADATIKERADTRAPYDRDPLDREIALPEVIEAAQRVADGLGIPEVIARDLAPYDELAETAEAYGRAIVAAATCQLRRGV